VRPHSLEQKQSLAERRAFQRSLEGPVKGRQAPAVVLRKTGKAKIRQLLARVPALTVGPWT